MTRVIGDKIYTAIYRPVYEGDKILSDDTVCIATIMDEKELGWVITNEDIIREN